MQDTNIKIHYKRKQRMRKIPTSQSLKKENRECARY